MSDTFESYVRLMVVLRQDDRVIAVCTSGEAARAAERLLWGYNLWPPKDWGEK